MWLIGTLTPAAALLSLAFFLPQVPRFVAAVLAVIAIATGGKEKKSKPKKMKKNGERERKISEKIKAFPKFRGICFLLLLLPLPVRRKENVFFKKKKSKCKSEN